MFNNKLKLYFGKEVKDTAVDFSFRREYETFRFEIKAKLILNSFFKKKEHTFFVIFTIYKNGSTEYSVSGSVLDFLNKNLPISKYKFKKDFHKEIEYHLYNEDSIFKKYSNLISEAYRKVFDIDINKCYIDDSKRLCICYENELSTIIYHLYEDTYRPLAIYVKPNFESDIKHFRYYDYSKDYTDEELESLQYLLKLPQIRIKALLNRKIH